MHMRFIPSLFLLFLVINGLAQEPPDWENPEIFARNQVAPHATLMPFQTVEKALQNRRKAAENYLSLNGRWQFHWAPTPAEAPDSFYQKNFDRNAWKQIRVPSNWQMEGFGHAIFRNIGYNFKPDPPRVPDNFNPAGSYYRTFRLPAQWQQKQVFLQFDGVQSAAYVWINGEKVGYNQGGMEPATFDVTPCLQSGENSIAVKVLRYCDGSYLEDQDTWRLSGIFRDVSLMATPKVHIRDFYITTPLDEAYEDATLRVIQHIRNYRNEAAQGYKARIQLYDALNQPVFESPKTKLLPKIDAGGTYALETAIPVNNPKKWSAEHPYLYTLTMELLDKTGEVTEVLSNKTGFREIEVKNQAVYVNGKAIKFNGVNSHMMHPETGHCMDEATLRKDLKLMKRFNINCVRTSHYPPNHEYLDMADSLGIYVIDETGDEAHATTYLSEQPEWRAQYLLRMKKMVYRDRNHPSVVIWSAGNESGHGENICALIRKGKEIDPSRPAWLYGGNRDQNPATNPIACEDIVGPRYLEPFLLENRFGKSDDPRPSFMDEYIAATGNGLGGMDEYWKLIRAYPRLTGGAIWDWVSPGITSTWTTTPDHSPHQIETALMHKARLVPGKWGKAVYFSGLDDWVEVYRHPALDISGDKLTLAFWVKPEPWNGHAYFLTKGNYQYGMTQSAPNKLSFYVHAGEKTAVEANVPENWTGQWHHITGIYNGKSLRLFIDGKLAGSTSCSGTITNGPYPVNIGKSSEIKDSHRGPLCHATLDAVRIFDSVVKPQQLMKQGKALQNRSALWLDFEETRKEEDFYTVGIPGRTYGVIWPDRSIQPELWQMKKSAQPVSITPAHLEQGRVRIQNHYHFTPLSTLAASWHLQANGKTLQEGSLEVDLAPGEEDTLTVPFEPPSVAPGTHYHLLVRFRQPEQTAWAPKNHEVAWAQFTLPFYKQKKPAQKPGAKALSLKEDKNMLQITGADFRYTFDKKQGLLTSIRYQEEEMLAAAPRFNAWRAPLANDLDAWAFYGSHIGQVQKGMGREVANGWRSAGLDQLAHTLDRFSVSREAKKIIVKADASVSARNYTTGFDVAYTYTIARSGGLSIETTVHPAGNMTHWLPKIGLQLKIPKTYHHLKWFGRGPFETYPDRETGAKTGVYSTTADADDVPYLIPQDYGNKTGVYWAEVTNPAGKGLRIKGGERFQLSLHKYAPENLTRALYRPQLQEDTVLTLNLDHRVSGVGGTANSVLPKYRVYPGNYSFTFHLMPVETESP